MIYPNKNIRFKESLLHKMTVILMLKNQKEIRIENLFEQVKEEFETIDQFLLSLDVLYILDAIYLDEENQNIIYAD